MISSRYIDEHEDECFKQKDKSPFASPKVAKRNNQLNEFDESGANENSPKRNNVVLEGGLYRGNSEKKMATLGVLQSKPYQMRSLKHVNTQYAIR